MSGGNQAAPSRDLQFDSTDKVVGTQTCEVSSLREVEVLVKYAIWERRVQIEELIAINVNRSKSERGGFEIRFEYDHFEENSVKGFDTKIIMQQQQESEYYLSDSTQPLYQKVDTVVPVDVLVASHSLLSFPAVIKLYHCGFSNINRFIQEALLQVKLTSSYTCKLLDIFIRKGSKDLFEVGLVMERLKGDLEADIKHRVQLGNPYSESELRCILKCMTEALAYAKFRVGHI